MPIAAIWAAIKAFGIWQRISDGLRWLFAHPMAALALALGIWGFVEHRAAVKWEGAYHKLVAQTQSASTKAATDQAAVNHRPAAISAAISERIDHEADADIASAMAAARAYADAHRVRRTIASSPIHADLPRADHAAPRDDRPSEAPKLDAIAISQDDFDACTVNSERLAKVRDAAQALIASGAARASDQP